MKKNVWKPVFIFYLFILHLLLAGVLWKSDFIEKARFKLGLWQPSEITPYFRNMLTYHKSIDGNVPSGSVVFIGDSITQGLCVSAVSNPSVNYGIGGDTSVGVLKRLESYQCLKRAKIVVLAIGINDMKFRSNKEILKNIVRIRSKVPTNRPVLISGVLPVDNISNSKIQWDVARIGELNVLLKRFADNTQNTYFSDAGTLMTDHDGKLCKNLHIGDGVHLSTEGNRIFISSLKNALNKIEQGVAPDGE